MHSDPIDMKENFVGVLEASSYAFISHKLSRARLCNQYLISLPLQVFKLDRSSPILRYVVVLIWVACWYSEMESSIFVNEAEKLNKLVYSMMWHCYLAEVTHSISDPFD